MTKSILYTLALISFALFTLQCENTGAPSGEGTTIQGKIGNAAEVTVFVDKLLIGKASNVVTSTKTDKSGKFSISFPEGMPAGIYNLRVDKARIGMAFTGKEKTVEINGDLNQLPKYKFEVKGSPDTKVLRDLIQKMLAGTLNATGLETFIDTTSNAELGAFLAYQSLGSNYIELQKKALTNLQKVNPTSETAVAYDAYIKQLEYKKKARNTGPIAVGQDAPDIRLTSPSGKEYALSDLKGQIVLLDFWASWCRPCRSENPNVVKVYEKYKSQGFTVFSVSLDSNRDRWDAAIQQDKLSWPYHVSDLQKWKSAPAAVYGVRSIPRAFLIDKDGKIAATTVRGAAQLEEELKKLLN